MKLSNGVEPTGRSQPVATKSLIARNRSHTRKRAPAGAIYASALAAEPRPRQHLTLQQFLAPLTAPRCPLLGNNPLGRIRLSEKWHDGCPNRRSRGQSLGNIGPTSVHHVPLFPTHRRTRNGYRSKNSPKSFGTTKPSSPT